MLTRNQSPIFVYSDRIDELQYVKWIQFLLLGVTYGVQIFVRETSYSASLISFSFFTTDEHGRTDGHYKYDIIFIEILSLSFDIFCLNKDKQLGQRFRMRSLRLFIVTRYKTVFYPYFEDKWSKVDMTLILSRMLVFTKLATSIHRAK